MRKIEYKKRTKEIEIKFYTSSMLNDEEKEEILKSITPRTLINVSILKNTTGFVPLAEYQNDFKKLTELSNQRDNLTEQLEIKNERWLELLEKQEKSQN